MRTPLLALFWLAFIFLTQLGLLNLIIGIFCENALVNAESTERELLQGRDEKRRATMVNLIKAFDEMDLDGDGIISHPEYIHAITTDVTVMQCFIELGLSEEENLFGTLDPDSSGGITLDQFFDGVMLIMKGQETAKAKDIVGTHLLCKSVAKHVTELCTNVKGMQKTRINHAKELGKLCKLASSTGSEVSSLGQRYGELASEIREVRELLLSGVGVSGPGRPLSPRGVGSSSSTAATASASLDFSPELKSREVSASSAPLILRSSSWDEGVSEVDPLELCEEQGMAVASRYMMQLEPGLRPLACDLARCDTELATMSPRQTSRKNEEDAESLCDASEERPATLVTSPGLVQMEPSSRPRCDGTAADLGGLFGEIPPLPLRLL